MSGGKPFSLGLIGLGIMGAPIAKRLLAQGWDLTVWNLEPERFEAVKEAGAKWADTPAALRRHCDVVLMCILGDDAIKSVCFGENGLSSSSGASVVIDMSTTDIETTRECAGRLDMDWLDAPMSGGPQPAEQGQLTFMVGGDQALLERVKPVLDDMGANVTLMGPLGAGQTTKLINQAIVGANYLVMAEVLALVRAGGVAGDKLAQCLMGGLADSAILQRIYPQMLERDFGAPKSTIKQVNKDLKSVKAFAQKLGLELPVLFEAFARYDEYSAGHEKEDGASVSLMYERGEGR